MAHRIEVGFKPAHRDAHGERVRERVRSDLGIALDQVRTIDVYTLDMDLSAEELENLAAGPFSDPIIHVWGIDTPLAGDFDWLVEVGLRPGVTDNVGRTALEAAMLRLGRSPRDDEKIFASRQYLFSGALSRDQVERISSGLLANDLIQSCTIVDASGFDPVCGLQVPVPRVTSDATPHVALIDLTVGDDTLMRMSRDGLLALNLDEMKAIQAYFTRTDVNDIRKSLGMAGSATDVELEVLAQTWSEHCKHKIFNATIAYDDGSGSCTEIRSLFDTCIKGSTRTIRERLGKRDWCVSVFKDNAGVIAWSDEYHLVFKVETHNSPSALDPYGGALTGIVGVNRDTLGTGKAARLIFNTDVFCFADPFYSSELPPRILHPRRIFEGVREGVEHGGNKSGIPTVNGSIVFDDRFLGKPLVYCGTGGLMPVTVLGQPSEEKTACPGDLIIMTGGRIGKDGIHGATFSSEELHEGSPVTAVQIGDPITQKRMADFIMEVRDRGLFRCITDNGAGGLSSSVGEMAEFSGGCELDLKLAPLKYSGLQPWEILISESQERMTFAVPPENREAFLDLADKMRVEATVLGTFTDSGFFHVRYGRETVAYLAMEFLHGGLPEMRLKAVWKEPRHAEPASRPMKNLTGTLKGLLGRLNICSKEYVVRQYDHEVQGGSVIKPLCGRLLDGPSDAAVIRPVLESMRGVVISHGICPRYSDIDTYHMMACAIDEALRNFVSVGGNLDGLGGLDNFCWCDPVQSEKTPDGEYKLAQLVRANQALYDYTTAYTIPCISGKDSMKNDYMIGDHKISIPPTVLFSLIGAIDDARLACSMDAKRAGDLVYVLGETREETGGSEYFTMLGAIGNRVPRVNAQRALALYRALNTAIRSGLVRSCHDCSDGGLGVALAETAFAGELGMCLDLQNVPVDGHMDDDVLLFSETQSRFVVTVAPEHARAFEDCLAAQACACAGEVTADGLFSITGTAGEIVVRSPVAELKEAWQAPLRW
jgi:phosphoribosylformylglycinamidine synthase subunit PurSL